jgi:hypothetical protein
MIFFPRDPRTARRNFELLIFSPCSDGLIANCLGTFFFLAVSLFVGTILCRFGDDKRGRAALDAMSKGVSSAANHCRCLASEPVTNH